MAFYVILVHVLVNVCLSVKSWFNPRFWENMRKELTDHADAQGLNRLACIVIGVTFAVAYHIGAKWCIELSRYVRMREDA